MVRRSDERHRFGRGGTKIAAGVISPQGKLLGGVPDRKSPGTPTLDRRRGYRRGQERIRGRRCCLAVPGVILARENKVLSAANLEAIEGIPPQGGAGWPHGTTGDGRE